VKDDFLPYAREVETALRDWGVRTEVDLREEKLSRKIRDAQLQKVPYMLVVGAKEAEGRKVSVRERAKGDLGEMSLEGLEDLLNQEFNPF
jgi:threonyl-tRNA synthetase